MLNSQHALGLRVREVVEVRSLPEILRTLDHSGKLEALPFMPEMRKHCGLRFRVFKRADKTCDTIDKTGLRRMINTVLLEGVRCDGEAHDGCQAGCLIFWKEAWLKRVTADAQNGATLIAIGSSSSSHPKRGEDEVIGCTEADLMRATRVASDLTTSDGETLSCQVTELKKATLDLPWWDIRQYIRDMTSGNIGFLEGVRGLLIMLFNGVQCLRGGNTYPYMEQGKLKTTPRDIQNLQPGELVQVKTKEEILQTLDTNNKNRGLWFDVEMLKFCGGRFRVLRRVEQLIDEKTGRMIKVPNDCIVLDGVTCNGECHSFCPRTEHIYWREIWLRRVKA